MGKNLMGCVGSRLSQLKGLCGLGGDSGMAKDDKAVAAIRREPIPAPRFLHLYRKRRKHDQQVATEFKAVSKNQEDHPTTAALRNVLYNVKQDSVPYDHSRVRLTSCPLPDVDNDYINASYIDGYSILKEYIATQGPTAKTVTSFWHMVWQEGVRCIVMATGLFENAVQQCDKYWNDMVSSHRHVRHGDIHIWNEDSVFMAQLTIRTFRIQRDGGFEQRLVRQYEMVGFHEESPDSGLLLDVRRRVCSFASQVPGPILVHCRCGAGRSAVFLAVDYCLKQLEMEEGVDIYSAVLHLRRFRKNMVRTLPQYRQVHAAVAMFLQCGVTVYSASALPWAYTSHYGRHAQSSVSKLDKEHQVLKTIVPRLSIGDCASGHRVENRNKSRDIMMLPPERARPYLMTSEQGDTATDFINAVYVDGYHQENTFLVTQWPKRHTVNDLWRLLFDFKITSLVVLNEVKFSRTYPKFWPKQLDCRVRYGPISVRYLGCGKYPHLVVRAFAIHKVMTSVPGCEVREEDVVVKMFQVCGGGTKKPSKGRVSLPPESLLATLQAAEGWQRRNNPLNPVCILSKDGASRCGIFCAVHICCDQLRHDGEVDVFNAVRLVRYNRPQLVISMDEYRYVYSFMADYVLALPPHRGPQIVITGTGEEEEEQDGGGELGKEEGDGPGSRHVTLQSSAPCRPTGPRQSLDGLSTDDSVSCVSSQAGSFETALDDVMDCVLPANPEVQARLSACIAQLSPHLSHRIYMSDRYTFPSTPSVSSLPHHHNHHHHLHPHLYHPHHHDHHHPTLPSVGFMAASVANVFTPDVLKEHPLPSSSSSSALLNGFNSHHRCCSRLQADKGEGQADTRSLDEALVKAVSSVRCCSGTTVEGGHRSERTHKDEKQQTGQTIARKNSSEGAFCSERNQPRDPGVVKSITRWCRRDSSSCEDGGGDGGYVYPTPQGSGGGGNSPHSPTTSNDNNAGLSSHDRFGGCYLLTRVNNNNNNNNNNNDLSKSFVPGTPSVTQRPVLSTGAGDASSSRCLAVDGDGGCERGRWLQRRNTDDSFHSAASSFNLART